MATLSLVAGFAPSFEWLVAARSLQGIAAAPLIPSETAYLRKNVALSEPPGVLGTSGAMISTGAALGPVVGGLILAAAGWHWMFLLNLPDIAVVWLLLMPMPADAGTGRATFQLNSASLAALIGRRIADPD